MLLYMRQRHVHIDTHKKELDTLEMPKFPLCHKHWMMSISVAFYHNLHVDILFRNFSKKQKIFAMRAQLPLNSTKSVFLLE